MEKKRSQLLALTRRHFILGSAGLVGSFFYMVTSYTPFNRVFAKSDNFNDKEMELVRQILKILLPSYLTDKDVAQTSESFNRWLASYNPKAETHHGRYRPTQAKVSFFVPDSPIKFYRAQLADIKKGVKSGKNLTDILKENLKSVPDPAVSIFGSKTPEQKKDDGFAHSEGDPQLLMGLLAHYYKDSTTIDRMLKARVGFKQCRGLANVGEKPEALV